MTKLENLFNLHLELLGDLADERMPRKWVTPRQTFIMIMDWVNVSKNSSSEFIKEETYYSVVNKLNEMQLAYHPQVGEVRTLLIELFFRVEKEYLFLIEEI